jgi:hypothetical protein
MIIIQKLKFTKSKRRLDLQSQITKVMIPAVLLVLVCWTRTVAASFNRILLRQHHSSIGRSQLVYFDTNQFKIDGQYTFTFWVQTAKALKTNVVRPLLTFVGEDKTQNGFWVNEKRDPINNLNFDSYLIDDSIEGTATLSTTSSFWRINKFQLVSWRFVTVSVQVVDRTNARMLIATNTIPRLDINISTSYLWRKFIINIGGTGFESAPATLIFHMFHLYVYDQFYATQFELDLLLQGAPGTIMALLKPQVLSSYENSILNFAPGRTRHPASIIRSGYSIIPRADSNSFIFDSQLTHIELPPIIINQSPTDQSYIFSILYAIYAPIEMIDYLNNPASTISTPIQFALYQRTSLAAPSNVLIGGKWVLTGKLNFELLFTIDNADQLVFQSNKPVAELASAGVDHQVLEANNFIVSVSHNILQVFRRIRFVFYGSNEGQVMSDVLLLENDVHICGKKTQENYPSILIHVFEISIISGSHFSRNDTLPTNPSQNDYIKSLNEDFGHYFVDSDHEPFVISCAKNPNPRRLMPDRNEFILRKECSVSQTISENCPSIPNCLFCYKSTCFSCRPNYELSGGLCLPCNPSTKTWFSMRKTCEPITNTLDYSLHLPAAYSVATYDAIKLSVPDFVVALNINVVTSDTTNRPNKSISVAGHSLLFRTFAPTYQPSSSVTVDNSLIYQSLISSIITDSLDLMSKSNLRPTLMTLAQINAPQFTSSMSTLFFSPFFNCTSLASNARSFYTNRHTIQCQSSTSCPSTKIGYDATQQICYFRASQATNIYRGMVTTCNSQSSFTLMNNNCIRWSAAGVLANILINRMGWTKILNLQVLAEMLELMNTAVASDKFLFPKDLTQSLLQMKESLADQCPQLLSANVTSSYISALCIENCKKFDANCNKCSNTQCLSCLPGYELSGNVCLKAACIDKKCQICVDAASCVVCKTPFERQIDGSCDQPLIAYWFAIYQELKASGSSSDMSLSVNYDPQFMDYQTGSDCIIPFCLFCNPPNTICYKCRPFHEFDVLSKSCKSLTHRAIELEKKTQEEKLKFAEDDSCTFCQKCQVKSELLCPNCAKCNQRCPCRSRPSFRKDLVSIECDQVVFSIPVANSIASEERGYSLQVPVSLNHTISAKIYPGFKSPGAISIEGRLVVETGLCTFTSYLIEVQNQNRSNTILTPQTKTQVKTTYFAIAATALFLTNILSSNTAQILLSLVDVTSYIVYFYLLDLDFGSLFDVIMDTLTEPTLNKHNLINGDSLSHGYAQLYYAVESRGWKYLSPMIYKFLIFLTAAFVFVNFFVEKILTSLLSEKLAKRTENYTSQFRSKMNGVYVTAQEMNYMSVMPLMLYFIATCRNEKTLLGFFERLLGVMMVIVGAVYSKYHKYETLKKIKAANQHQGPMPIMRAFATNSHSLSIHTMIEEQIQAVSALILFAMQQYKLPAIAVLIAASIGQILLCYIFLGKYRWFISLMKIVCYLAMLSFFIGASFMAKGLPPDSSFFNWMIGLVIVFKVLEVLLSLIDSAYRWKQHCTLNKVKPIKTKFDQSSMLIEQTSHDKVSDWLDPL